MILRFLVLHSIFNDFQEASNQLKQDSKHPLCQVRVKIRADRRYFRLKMKIPLKETLVRVARFYDRRKVGEGSFLGFRRSSDLARLLACLEVMMDQGLLNPGETLFLDMGCADGRVNVLLSYLVSLSIGIEMDEWTLNEYLPLKRDLELALKDENLPLPPDNIFLFHGDSSDEALHESIKRRIDVDFGEIDLFYTYLTMPEEFAEIIARKAKKDAVFMVYGLGKILPRFEGLRLLTPERPLEDILALYRKG